MNIGMGVGLDGAPGQGAIAPETVLFDLDFVNAIYVGGTLTGVLQEVGNFVNSPYEWADGIVRTSTGSTIQRTSNGLEVWPDRTNVCLWNRDLTNAAWVKANVTAVLNQTGKGGTANTASSITATAVLGTVLQTITLASSARFQSAYVKRLVGTGTLEMTMDGGVTWTDITPADANWVRAKIATQTLANPIVGFRIGTSGDSFAIDFVQNENSNTPTPPIITTSVAVNRPQNRATCLSKPPMVNLAQGAFGFYWEGTADALSGRGLIVSDDTNTALIFGVDGSVSFASSSPVTTPAGQFNLLNGINKIAGSKAVDGSIKLCVNGNAVVTGNRPLSPTLTHFDMGTNGAGTSNIRGIIRRWTMFKAPMSDAKLLALTT